MIGQSRGEAWPLCYSSCSDFVQKISALGIVPYVADGGLQTIGMSHSIIKDAEPLTKVSLTR